MFQRESTLTLQTRSSTPALMKSPVVQIPFQTGKFSSWRNKIHKNEQGKKKYCYQPWFMAFTLFFFLTFLFPLFWVFFFFSIWKGLFWISKASDQWSLCSHCCYETESMIMYRCFKHERMCIRDSILVIVIIMLCYWIARNDSNL